jgi:hypothetical protein
MGVDFSALTISIAFSSHGVLVTVTPEADNEHRHAVFVGDKKGFLIPTSCWTLSVF